MNLNFVARAVLFALVALVAVTLSQHILLVNSQNDLGIDFRVFERASTAPADLVYQPHRAPFAYPPTALLIMKPLTAFGYWFWAAASLALFAVAVALVAGKKIAALSLAAPAVLKGLVQGQVALLLGGLLFLGLRLSPLLGGALWGVAAAIKPQMLIFAPIALIARRDWPMLGGMIFGGLGMLVASLLLLDLSLWPGWLEALNGFNQMIDHGAMTKVISPAGQAVGLGLPSAPFIVGGLVLGLAAMFIVAPRVEGAYLVALIVAAGIVASPYVHLYDAAPLIPACLLLMRGKWLYAIPAGLIITGIVKLMALALVFILVAALYRKQGERNRGPVGAGQRAAASRLDAGGTGIVGSQ